MLKSKTEDKTEFYLSPQLKVTEDYLQTLSFEFEKIGHDLRKCHKRVLQYQTFIEKKTRKITTCVICYVGMKV